MKVTRINRAKTRLEIDGKKIYLTDKSINKKIISMIGTFISVLAITAMMLFIIYAYFFGPHDYWSREGDTMVLHHIDWNGNESVIDSYKLFQ